MRVFSDLAVSSRHFEKVLGRPRLPLRAFYAETGFLESG